jgi:hypothetical protein
MNQRHTGWALLLSSCALLALNMADAVANLDGWHGATTPEFVAVLLRQSAAVALAALGGKMLPPFAHPSKPKGPKP